MNNQEVEKQIITYLSGLPNTFVLFDTIKQNISLQYIVSSEFNNICSQLPQKYNNIRLSDDNKCLIYDLASNNNIMRMIEEYLKNPSNNQNQISLTKYIDGIRTPIHLICKEQRKDLLQILIDNFDFNTDSYDSEGNKPDDCLPLTNCGYEMHNMLIRYSYDKQINKLIASSYETKKYNSYLTEYMVSIREHNIKLNSQNIKLDAENIWLKVMLKLLLVILSVSLTLNFL
jgi:hypothetical protein